MKVQTRLSLFSSIAFGIVFIAISCLVYILYEQSSRNSVYRALRNSAHVVGLFYFEKDELDTREFSKVRKRFDKIMHGVSYQVYDVQNQVVIGNKADVLRKDTLEQIRKNGTFDFLRNNQFCHGLYYEDNQGDFVIVTRVFEDTVGRQLFSLFIILATALVVGLVAVVLLSRWLAKTAYKPVSDIIRQVEGLSLEGACAKINSPNTRDELQELTDTFNELLKRITESFIIQQNFVNYVSHEFRTPLTSMLGNLEVFSLKSRNSEEYSRLAEEIIEEIMHLQETLDALLVVSDLQKEADVENHVRIDELVWEIVRRMSASYKKVVINPKILIPSDDILSLTVKGVRTQVYIALFNIIENAVKYSSQKPVDIFIYKERGTLCLSVEDRGIGIPDEQLPYVSRPFFRAGNTGVVSGSGIGLSVALRILEKNNMLYVIESNLGVGTKIIIRFPEVFDN